MRSTHRRKALINEKRQQNAKLMSPISGIGSLIRQKATTTMGVMAAHWCRRLLRLLFLVFSRLQFSDGVVEVMFRVLIEVHKHKADQGAECREKGDDEKQSGER